MRLISHRISLNGAGGGGGERLSSTFGSIAMCMAVDIIALHNTKNL